VGLSVTEEHALVARAKAGDEQAFEALVRSNAPRLYAVVLRCCANEADAEEATQDAFVRAWRSLQKFRNDARFFTWLYRIGLNEAARVADRNCNPPASMRAEERPLEAIQGDAPEPQARAEQSELRRILEDALRRLPEKYRSPVVLRDIEGMTTAEAANALGLREAGFKSRLHRGRLLLGREVGDYVGRDGPRG
jgi:RNA polymerase sigma-70 factor (ECF subfamily)